MESRYTYLEVTANSPGIIIKKTKWKSMHTERCGNNSGQDVAQMEA
jgi:hypothetical protein